MDPITVAAGGELARAGGGVLSRLFGPTADVMGGELARWYERRYVKRVFDRADEISSEGTIPLRVAAEVFEKAQWAEDEFVAEYLSGVLAGARRPGGKDDRGIAWTSLVGRMSSDQLRLHYIFSRALRDELVADTVARLDRIATRPKPSDSAVHTVYVDDARPNLSDALQHPLVLHSDDVKTAMFGEKGDPETLEARLMDAVFGLEAEGLIKAGNIGAGLWLNGNPHIYRVYPDWPVISAKFLVRGARLTMESVGLGDVWPLALANPTDNPLDRLIVNDMPEVRGTRYDRLAEKTP